MNAPLTLPSPLLDLLRHWGPRWQTELPAARDAMFPAYAALLPASAPAGVQVHLDLPYGADPRQVLDVYAPPRATQARPVMMFVHGGGFVRGDKDQGGGLFANVLHEFAAVGWLGINVEYRLAPHATWPAGAEDVRDALKWVHDHAAEQGGDPRRIFLFAHSAGCAHVASAVWDERLRPAGHALPLAGLILASPRVRADLRPDNINAAGVAAYFGNDPAQFDDRAPLLHARPDAPPTFVALAQYENPLIDVYALELAHHLAQIHDTRGGPMPRVLQLPDHNHYSVMAQFNTPHNRLGAEIRDWCARVERGEFAGKSSD
ncbi:alpha/beta hydrolase [Hydrogenophaga sp.]|uniref:alpha/beta hydrolase n=1 Tax=Hydrogenophaga sp. TaxID=1904254 RepID=UPI0025B7DA90|nr:alpha/beta hydrolase [Hydrogenophaga sp.]